MIAISASRVPAQTRPEVNQRIERDREARVSWFREHPEQVEGRLRELDQEWDVERALETGSATLSLVGLGLGMLTGRRRWFLLPLAVQGFFLQHALQGWCPPLPVLRGLGFRTVREIEEERRQMLAAASPAREGLSGG